MKQFLVLSLEIKLLYNNILSFVNDGSVGQMSSFFFLQEKKIFQITHQFRNYKFSSKNVS